MLAIALLGPSASDERALQPGHVTLLGPNSTHAHATQNFTSQQNASFANWTMAHATRLKAKEGRASADGLDPEDCVKCEAGGECGSMSCCDMCITNICSYNGQGMLPSCDACSATSEACASCQECTHCSECDDADKEVPGAAVFSAFMAPVMQLPRQEHADALDDAVAANVPLAASGDATDAKRRSRAMRQRA